MLITLTYAFLKTGFAVALILLRGEIALEMDFLLCAQYIVFVIMQNLPNLYQKNWGCVNHWRQQQCW